MRRVVNKINDSLMEAVKVFNYYLCAPLRSKCKSVCHCPCCVCVCACYPPSPPVLVTTSLSNPSSPLPPHPESSWVIKHEMKQQTNCLRSDRVLLSISPLSSAFYCYFSTLALSQLSRKSSVSFCLCLLHVMSHALLRDIISPPFIMDELSGVGFTLNLPTESIHVWTNSVHPFRLCMCVFFLIPFNICVLQLCNSPHDLCDFCTLSWDKLSSFHSLRHSFTAFIACSKSFSVYPSGSVSAHENTKFSTSKSQHNKCASFSLEKMTYNPLPPFVIPL